jgi:hypothetical protein
MQARCFHPPPVRRSAFAEHVGWDGDLQPSMNAACFEAVTDYYLYLQTSDRSR